MGALIKHIGKAKDSTEEDNIYKIKTIQSNFQDVIIEEVDSEGNLKPAPKPKAAKSKSVANELTVARADLLLKYTVHEIKAKEFLGDYPRVCDHADVFATVVKGEITAKMIALHGKSTENDVGVLLKPTRTVLADKDFNAGAMKIVPVSLNVVFITMGKAAPSNALCIGKSEQQFVNIYLRSSNNLLKDPKFISKFYMVRMVNDSRIANCEVQSQTINLKFNGEDIPVKLPMAVNTRKVHSGEEILMLSPADLVEPGAPTKCVKKN